MWFYAFWYELFWYVYMYIKYHVLCNTKDKKYSKMIKINWSQNYNHFYFSLQSDLQSYCRAHQEWQWHNTLFTIAKSNTNMYTSLELIRIDRSLVY